MSDCVIPANARKPRTPIRIKKGCHAWYYVEPSVLSVYACQPDEDKEAMWFKLTRRQLEQALAVMDAWP